VVKVVLVLVLYFGFVIQQYVIVDMLWPVLKRSLDTRLSTKKYLHLPAEMAFKALLVIIASPLAGSIDHLQFYSLVVLAMAVPNLEHIIPLIGISAGMLLAFIFPPLVSRTFYRCRYQYSEPILDGHRHLSAGADRGAKEG